MVVTTADKMNDDHKTGLWLSVILRQENRHRFLPHFRLVAFIKSLNL